MKMPGKRAKPVVETQMISLADIAFLIIFFFMLTSQFMRESAAIRLAEWLDFHHVGSWVQPRA